jgi:hypothetical protein
MGFLPSEFYHSLLEIRDIAKRRGIRSLKGLEVHCGGCGMPFVSLGACGPGVYHAFREERCRDEDTFMMFMKDGHEVGTRHGAIAGGLLSLVVYPRDEPLDTNPFLDARINNK